MLTDNILTLISLLCALGFIAAGIMAWKAKEWQRGFIVLVMGLFCFLLPNFGWLTGIGKTVFGSQVLQTIRGLGIKLDEFHSSLDEMKQELSQQQETVSVQQQELKEMQGQLQIAQQDIAIQQKRLMNVEELVKPIFGKITKEVFSCRPQVTPRCIAIPHGDQKASIFFKLVSVPIPETVVVQWWIHTQPPTSFRTYKNIIGFRWGDSVSKLKQHEFYVTYVPDGTQAGEETAMSLDEDKVFVEEQWFQLWRKDPRKTPPEPSKQPPEARN